MSDKPTVMNLPIRRSEATSPSDTSSGTMIEGSSLNFLLEMAQKGRDPSGGGGGDGGNTEARIAKLESSVEYIQRDISEIKEALNFVRDVKLESLDGKIDSKFIWTIGIIITLFGSLAGIMAKGFKWF